MDEEINIYKKELSVFDKAMEKFLETKDCNKKTYKSGKVGFTQRDISRKCIKEFRDWLVEKTS